MLRVLIIVLRFSFQLGYSLYFFAFSICPTLLSVYLLLILCIGFSKVSSD